MISSFRYVLRSLRYYAGAHALVALGVAVATMVLTGALIIGDSVRASLLRTVELRLGRAAFVFAGADRLFTSSLAEGVRHDIGAPTAPVMLADGIASSQGGALRVPSISIWGIDDHFIGLDPQSNTDLTVPGPGAVYISENLANRLEISEGGDMLLRIDRLSNLPRNAPFVSGEDDAVTARVKVERIFSEDFPGRFNLRTSQTAPFNVFMSIESLNHLMGQTDMANRLLFGGGQDIDAGSVAQAVQRHWSLADAGLQVIPSYDSAAWEVTSGRVFIDSVVVQAARALYPDVDLILTYFANALKHEGHATPYSFVSAGNFMSRADSKPPEMLINTWLADDLQAGKGDTIAMDYFVIGPLRRLEEKSAVFIVRDVVPMSGEYADRDLMPDIPGLTDAGNCSDWETGVPVDLGKIRAKDETYWDEWKGTPKAFIDYPTGKALWENRFGACTMMRYPATKCDRTHIVQHLETQLPPARLGFSVEPVLELGLTAARSGVDFSQLFVGLSFFLLLAGLILLALLLNLHMERRMSQAGTLRALGFSDGGILRLLLGESLLIALGGVVLGGLLSIAYNKAIFAALKTVWNEIVLTTTLKADIQPLTLLLGMLSSFLLAAAIIWINLRRRLRMHAAALSKSMPAKAARGRWIALVAWLFGIGAPVLLAYQYTRGDLLNSGIFFTAGGMLLVAMLLGISRWILARKDRSSQMFTMRTFTVRGIYRNRSRSMRIIVLFALGTFVVISTGLNRKDLHSEAMNRTSGTGGFLFYGETTLPVLRDLNNGRVQTDLGLDTALRFVQMRKTLGDDASCLNLNRVSRPRILGVQPEALKGRFSMVKALPLVDPGRPWMALEQDLADGVVPAIADQTVILWGLGKQVGDTLSYVDGFGRTMTLKLVAGLANSVFQGNVLIGESHFLEHFPASSGSHVFLIDGVPAKKQSYEDLLQRVFRSGGLDLTDAADRLAQFNSVENTYLSIFLMLGGLGMILGAVGLGIALARNILDRRKELALLKSTGFTTASILGMLAREHMLLLGLGTFAGTATAIIATLPSILSDYVQASWQTALIIVLMIVLNGLFWVLLIANRFVRRNLLEGLRGE